MANKAHTATTRRLAQRFGGAIGRDGQPDVTAGDMLIEVETAATLAEGIARLVPLEGRRYVAVTNREALAEALRLTEGTEVGVMTPQGEIVRESHP